MVTPRSCWPIPCWSEDSFGDHVLYVMGDGGRAWVAARVIRIKTTRRTDHWKWHTRPAKELQGSRGQMRGTLEQVKAKALEAWLADSAALRLGASFPLWRI